MATGRSAPALALLLCTVALVHSARLTPTPCPVGQIFKPKAGGCKPCNTGLVKVPDDATTVGAQCVNALDVCGTAQIAVRGSCKTCGGGKVRLNETACIACEEGFVRYPLGDDVVDGQCVEQAKLLCRRGKVYDLQEQACTRCPEGTVKVPNIRTTTGMCVDGRTVCGTAEVAFQGSCEMCPDKLIAANAIECGTCPRGTTKVPLGYVRDAVCMDPKAVSPSPPPPPPSPRVVVATVTEPAGNLPPPPPPVPVASLPAVTENATEPVVTIPTCSAGHVWSASVARCVCDAGTTTSCGVGVCKRTVPTCDEQGVANQCVPGVADDPNFDTCDGKDNDCDGQIDEDYQGLLITCGSGSCVNTIPVCLNGQWYGDADCKPLDKASVEVCDGIDNDCDGEVDEGLNVMVDCGLGACKRQVPGCINGVAGVCTPGVPQEENYGNGIDDNCDGIVADEFLECGVGACRRVVASRDVNGTMSICVPGQPTEELCNGIDDNCNGNVDEGYQICGVGTCATLAIKCYNGQPAPCPPLVGCDDEAGAGPAPAPAPEEE